MSPAHTYFRLMMTALRNDGHAILIDDAEAARLIAAGLETICPDDPNDTDTAEALAPAFYDMAETIDAETST